MQELSKDLVEKLSTKLRSMSMMLVTAESCTGGMIGAAMTDRAGSSAVFERGFITYSNDAKMELLNVPRQTLKDHGAVSPETVIAMAHGALNNSHAELAISVTGVAGPEGGSIDKPVGLVYIGYGMKHDAVHSAEHHFEGDRASIRQQTVEAALEHMIKFTDTL